MARLNISPGTSKCAVWKASAWLDRTRLTTWAGIFRCRKATGEGGRGGSHGLHGKKKSCKCRYNASCEFDRFSGCGGTFSVTWCPNFLRKTVAIFCKAYELSATRPTRAATAGVLEHAHLSNLANAIAMRLWSAYTASLFCRTN